VRNAPLIARVVTLIVTLLVPITQAQSQAMPRGDSLRTGDIVLTGNDSAWAFFARRFADHDPRWSHAGLVLREGEKVAVVHMDGSPAGGRIRRESVAAFTGEARHVKVVRPSLDHGQRALIGDWLLDHLARQTTFDTRFRLDDDPSFYCSELVWRALDRVGLTPGDETLPRVAGRVFVPVDRLVTLGRVAGRVVAGPDVAASAVAGAR